MKHHALWIVCFTMLMFAACRKENKQPDDTPLPVTDAEIVSPADSTLWGHLGEDTGMSALQFITEKGDTLELYRTDPYTGEDGRLIGNIRNYTDRYAITLSPDSESMRTAINATQLSRKWSSAHGNIQFKSDGCIVAQDLPYKEWKLWNGHLLISSEQQHEYACVTRVDTMEITWLDEDSLVICDHIGQIIKLENKRE
ncbi:MAG: lipocalin family protein [Bacteroidaceae bacterium]|nr:lipocalin family protein [Bacteroidaceae bacterium]